jgi:hypothetical protein
VIHFQFAVFRFVVRIGIAVASAISARILHSEKGPSLAKGSPLVDVGGDWKPPRGAQADAGLACREATVSERGSPLGQVSGMLLSLAGVDRQTRLDGTEL